MKSKMTWLIAICLLILTPTTVLAQFEAMHFVKLPAVGSWAQYTLSSGGNTSRKVLRQKLSFLARQSVDGTEFFWFQLETESDDYGPKRVPVTVQFALTKEDAISGKDYFQKMRELIVQVDTAPAVRIARDFLAVGMQKGILSGGSRGAGTEVDFAFRDLEPESLTTKIGQVNCAHKKGLGKAEVTLSLEDTTRWSVDVIRDLWYNDGVPFGLVRQVSVQSGKGPQTESATIALDSEETIELVAYGAGATSAIRGQIRDYDPSQAGKFRPAAAAAQP